MVLERVPCVEATSPYGIGTDIEWWHPKLVIVGRAMMVRVLMKNVEGRGEWMSDGVRPNHRHRTINMGNQALGMLNGNQRKNERRIQSLSRVYDQYFHERWT